MFLKLLTGIFGLFGKIAELIQQRQLINAGKAEAKADQLQEVVNEIAEASTVRADTARANAGIDVTSELPDDGFRRD